MKEKLKKLFAILFIILLLVLGIFMLLEMDKKRREEKIIIQTIDNISYELLNEDKLDYKIKEVKLSKKDIEVEGKKKDVDKIASIKAEIDLENNKLEKLGTHEISSNPVYAYDNNNQKINNVDLKVKSISATIELEQYTNTIPIYVDYDVDFYNTPAIESIELSGAGVKDYMLTLKGKKMVNKVRNLASVLDYENVDFTKPFESETNFDFHEGVEYPTTEDTLKTKVTFGAAVIKEVYFSKVTFDGLEDGLDAKLSSDDYIKVKLKGTKEVMDQIKGKNPKGIKIFMRLSGYDVGTYQVPITEIKCEDRRIQYYTDATIEVKIYKE